MKGLLTLAGIIGVTSCRITPAPPPVPVQGNEEDVSAFSGEWSGRYRRVARRPADPLRDTQTRQAGGGTAGRSTAAG